MGIQFVLALPAPRFGVGPLKEDEITAEMKERNISTFKQQIELINEHFDDVVNGVTFLTPKRRITRDEVGERVNSYQTELNDIVFEWKEGIDTLGQNIETESDIDNKIEEMMGDLLDVMSAIISQHQERRIVVFVNGHKLLMMIQTFVARLAKTVPNLSFVHMDITSGKPSNLKNLKTSIFDSVEFSDSQVYYQQPSGKNSTFHRIRDSDRKMIAQMKDDNKQRIGLGEPASPNASKLDSPDLQGAHNTITAMKSRELLDNESKYTPHGIIVTHTHLGRPENNRVKNQRGIKGIVLPIGIGGGKPDHEENQKAIMKKAADYIDMMNRAHKDESGGIKFVKPIFVHMHDTSVTGVYEIAKLPAEVGVLKSHMNSIYVEISTQLQEIGRNEWEIIEPSVMLIGTGSIEYLAAGMLQSLDYLPNESKDGVAINWMTFASTWTGASAIVGADAMITLGRRCIIPIKEVVHGLELTIPCSEELLVELRRIELLLSLKFNALPKEKAYSCLLAATMTQDIATNPESCLDNRFKEGNEIRAVFKEVNLPSHWEGAKKKIDGTLKRDLENHGWIEFGNKGSVRLLREGRILGHVLKLHANGGSF